MTKEIRLLPLEDVSVENQATVRKIRNDENVRKWMYSDHIIGVNEHLRWLYSIKRDESRLDYVVVDKTSAPLGVVSVTSIDFLHSKADWAFYLSSSVRGGLGSCLERVLIDFVFNVLGLDKLNCEVIEGNVPVLSLHKKFLFQEEGFRRKNIKKDNDRAGVHFLGLTKEDWLAGVAQIDAKYSEKFARFSISIEAKPIKDSIDVDPIDQIEEARSKNNLNWMSILRLALEKAPSTAGPIVNEIKKIDRKISELSDELTEGY